MPGSIEERRAALAARHPSWEPVTLDGFLDRCAAEFPDRPLVITDDRTVTYAEVAGWARRLADGLVTLGVRPGDRVGLPMANHLEFVPLRFAIAYAGAVAVPFNYLYRARELAYVLRRSRCGVLVTMTDFAGLDHPAMLDEIAPGWRDGAAPALPDLRAVVALPTGGRPRPGIRTVADLAVLGAGHPGASAGARARPDEVGDILSTSGTTGSPKGVMLTHDAVRRTGYGSALTRAFEDGRRILLALPRYHMSGYVEGLIAAMIVGGAILPRTSFDPADYFAAIERHRATAIRCVPTMTVALQEHPDRHTRDLSSVFAILSGAAPAPVWLWQKVRAELGIHEITTGYGMTGCGGAMTMTLPEDRLEQHSGTVGRVKMAGVAGMPEFDGDLGRVRSDGYLQITGRSKELYESGGALVMPKEIEELLTGHPGVSQADAVGVPDERWGEVGCVWVAPEPGVDVDGDVDVDELIALCREELARFKVPRHVLVTTAAELPTTPTGQVRKFRLARRAARRLA